MKKFLVPLATAIAALVSQQSLASDTSPPDRGSLINPTTSAIDQGGAIVLPESMLSEVPSNLILVKAKANAVRAAHRSHSSHRSHRSHRSGR